MAKAYSYIRFSSAIQQKGDSLKRQTNLREEYLNEHPDLELDTTLNMTDLGISAYDKSNITKGALGHFLDLVKNGKIDRGSYLLVESLDRLSRAQVMDALEVFMGILNAGITIVSLADGIEYSRNDVDNNFTNLMMSIVVMSRATEESATKSRRIRRNWDNKRENISTKRLTLRCPYWMRPTNDKTGFELINENAEIVKTIFKMSKDGIGNSSIAKRLNEECVKHFSKKSNGWHESYIHKILNSKSVYGEFQMHTQRDGVIKSVDEPIENYYPAIMSKEEWHLCKSIRVERRTRGGVSKGKHLSNLFSGLLLCGYCHGSMVMGGTVKKMADGSQRTSRYVACHNARRGLGCKFTQWNYTDLEKQVIEFCRSVDFLSVIKKNNVGVENLENAEKKIIGLDIEIDNQKSKLKNLFSIIEGGSDQIPKSIIERIYEIESEIEKLNNEKKAAELKVSKLKSDAATNSFQQDAINELSEQLSTFSGNELHDLRIRLSQRIKRSIKNIYLHPLGSWISDDKRKVKEAELMEFGFSDIEISRYFNELELSVSKVNRYMMVIFENGDTLRVSSNNVMRNFKTMTIDEYFKK